MPNHPKSGTLDGHGVDRSKPLHDLGARGWEGLLRIEWCERYTDEYAQANVFKYYFVIGFIL
jgi:hypothetical protein